MNRGNIRTYLLLFSLMFCNLLLSGQKTAQKDEVFPKSWAGNWIGELEIWNNDSLQQTLPMELVINPIEGSENFDWWIIYGPDKVKGKRAYTLKPKDPSKGTWIVDENNGIALECYFFKDKLFSRYDVAGNALLVTNEIHGEEMIFEVMFGGDQPVSVTGDSKEGEEEIPAVKAFPIKGMQRAILTRNK